MHQMHTNFHAIIRVIFNELFNLCSDFREKKLQWGGRNTFQKLCKSPSAGNFCLLSLPSWIANQAIPLYMISLLYYSWRRQCRPPQRNQHQIRFMLFPVPAPLTIITWLEILFMSPSPSFSTPPPCSQSLYLWSCTLPSKLALWPTVLGAMQSRLYNVAQ